MPRILGIEIPGLRYIYGIGPARARAICKRVNIDPGKKTHELDDAGIAAIAQVLQESFVIEGDLRRQVAQDIRRLVAIGCYRGLRHRKGLPVRGQRTRTNARTRKGVRKTVGAIRDRSTRRLSRSEEEAKAEKKA